MASPDTMLTDRAARARNARPRRGSASSPITHHASRITILLAALLFAAAMQSPAHAGQPAGKAREAKLLAVLKSNADRKAKADACRLLARCASKDSVPTLAALLGDEKLAHMARYALEPCPDPAAGDALRDALGKLKGKLLVGVIGSVGVRRDPKAVGALTGLLGDTDAEVAKGAARALGNIGTPAAAAAIEAALPRTAAGNRADFCEGILRCAEALAAAGQTDDAAAIYDRLRTVKNVPRQIHTAALRGAALTRGKAGIPLLIEAIRGRDYVLVGAAARTAMEMPGPEITRAIADELAKLPADKQILMTLTLGVRRDPAALPALFALARKGEVAARIAAIRALPEIGDGAAVPVLLSLLADPEANVAKAAQTALSAVAGPTVDTHLIKMLAEGDAKTRLLAIDMLTQRRAVAAVPALVKAAADADEEVRVAAIKALGEMAAGDQFAALVGLLVKAKTPAEIRAAESALSALCTREAQPASGKIVIRKALYGDLPNGKKADVTKKVAAMVKRGALSIDASNANFGDPIHGIAKSMTIEFTVNGVTQTKSCRESDSITLDAGVTPPAFIDALCAAVAKAPTQPKLALLRVLRATHAAKALTAVRDATKDRDAEVRTAAIGILCAWPTADALPDCLQLAKTGASARDKILALRGCFRLIPLQSVPDDQKLASLKQAMALAQRTEEKRLALPALAAIPTPESLALVVPQLGNAALKEEACLAAVGIAEKILRRHPGPVATAMAQVVKTTANKRLAARARALLAQARKAAPRR